MAKLDTPQWDGETGTFAEHKENVQWFARQRRARDKDTVGPKLAAALTADAWKALEEISEEGIDLISAPGGEDVLIRYLEESPLDLPIPEAAKCMREYLFQFHCKSGESMKGLRSEVARAQRQA